MTGEVQDANEAMRHYWNTVAGPRWVAGPGFRERRNQESLALLLDRLRLAGGESVLEIGCGTGAVTLPLAQAVGEHGRVVAVDISEPMLAVARQRVGESGLHNVTLLLGDAQVLALRAGRIRCRDLAHGRHVLRRSGGGFPQHRRRAEAGRSPGLRLLGAARGEPALADLLRHRGAPFGPPAPSTEHEAGPLAFGNPDYIRRILAAAGFAEIAIERAHPTIIGGSPEEEARQALMMGPTARLIEAKKPDEATRQAIAEEIAAAFAAEASAGPIRLPATIFLVTARRPSS